MRNVLSIVTDPFYWSGKSYEWPEKDDEVQIYDFYGIIGLEGLVSSNDKLSNTYNQLVDGMGWTPKDMRAMEHYEFLKDYDEDFRQLTAKEAPPPFVVPQFRGEIPTDDAVAEFEGLSAGWGTVNEMLQSTVFVAPYGKRPEPGIESEPLAPEAQKDTPPTPSDPVMSDEYKQWLEQQKASGTQVPTNGRGALFVEFVQAVQQAKATAMARMQVDLYHKLRFVLASELFHCSYTSASAKALHPDLKVMLDEIADAPGSSGDSTSAYGSRYVHALRAERLLKEQAVSNPDLSKRGQYLRIEDAGELSMMPLISGCGMPHKDYTEEELEEKIKSYGGSYGGPLYTKIARAAQRLRDTPLNSADSLDAIDKAIDLVHNTGAALNKLQTYNNSIIEWFYKALDTKYVAAWPIQYADHMSPFVASLVDFYFQFAHGISNNVYDQLSQLATSNPGKFWEATSKITGALAGTRFKVGDRVWIIDDKVDWMAGTVTFATADKFRADIDEVPGSGSFSYMKVSHEPPPDKDDEREHINYEGSIDGSLALKTGDTGIVSFSPVGTSIWELKERAKVEITRSGKKRVIDNTITAINTVMVGAAFGPVIHAILNELQQPVTKKTVEKTVDTMTSGKVEEIEKEASSMHKELEWHVKDAYKLAQYFTKEQWMEMFDKLLSVGKVANCTTNNAKLGAARLWFQAFVKGYAAPFNVDELKTVLGTDSNGAAKFVLLSGMTKEQLKEHIESHTDNPDGVKAALADIPNDNDATRNHYIRAIIKNLMQNIVNPTEVPKHDLTPAVASEPAQTEKMKEPPKPKADGEYLNIIELFTELTPETLMFLAALHSDEWSAKDTVFEEAVKLGDGQIHTEFNVYQQKFTPTDFKSEFLVAAEAKSPFITRIINRGQTDGTFEFAGDLESSNEYFTAQVVFSDVKLKSMYSALIGQDGIENIGGDSVASSEKPHTYKNFADFVLQVDPVLLAAVVAGSSTSTAVEHLSPDHPLALALKIGQKEGANIEAGYYIDKVGVEEFIDFIMYEVTSRSNYAREVFSNAFSNYFDFADGTKFDKDMSTHDMLSKPITVNVPAMFMTLKHMAPSGTKITDGPYGNIETLLHANAPTDDATVDFEEFPEDKLDDVDWMLEHFTPLKYDGDDSWIDTLPDQFTLEWFDEFAVDKFDKVMLTATAETTSFMTAATILCRDPRTRILHADIPSYAAVVEALNSKYTKDVFKTWYLALAKRACESAGLLSGKPKETKKPKEPKEVNGPADIPAVDVSTVVDATLIDESFDSFEEFLYALPMGALVGVCFEHLRTELSNSLIGKVKLPPACGELFSSVIPTFTAIANDPGVYNLVIKELVRYSVDSPKAIEEAFASVSTISDGKITINSAQKYMIALYRTSWSPLKLSNPDVFAYPPAPPEDTSSELKTALYGLNDLQLAGLIVSQLDSDILKEYYKKHAGESNYNAVQVLDDTFRIHVYTSFALNRYAISIKENREKIITDTFLGDSPKYVVSPSEVIAQSAKPAYLISSLQLSYINPAAAKHPTTQAAITSMGFNTLALIVTDYIIGKSYEFDVVAKELGLEAHSNIGSSDIRYVTVYKELMSKYYNKEEEFFSKIAHTPMGRLVCEPWVDPHSGDVLWIADYDYTDYRLVNSLQALSAYQASFGKSLYDTMMETSVVTESTPDDEPTASVNISEVYSDLYKYNKPFLAPDPDVNEDHVDAVVFAYKPLWISDKQYEYGMDLILGLDVTPYASIVVTAMKILTTATEEVGEDFAGVIAELDPRFTASGADWNDIGAELHNTYTDTSLKKWLMSLVLSRLAILYKNTEASDILLSPPTSAATPDGTITIKSDSELKADPNVSPYSIEEVVKAYPPITLTDAQYALGKSWAASKNIPKADFNHSSIPSFDPRFIVDGANWSDISAELVKKYDTDVLDKWAMAVVLYHYAKYSDALAASAAAILDNKEAEVVPTAEPPKPKTWKLTPPDAVLDLTKNLHTVLSREEYLSQSYSEQVSYLKEAIPTPQVLRDVCYHLKQSTYMGGLATSLTDFEQENPEYPINTDKWKELYDTTITNLVNANNISKYMQEFFNIKIHSGPVGVVVPDLNPISVDEFTGAADESLDAYDAIQAVSTHHPLHTDGEQTLIKKWLLHVIESQGDKFKLPSTEGSCLFALKPTDDPEAPYQQTEAPADVTAALQQYLKYGAQNYRVAWMVAQLDPRFPDNGAHWNHVIGPALLSIYSPEVLNTWALALLYWKVVSAGVASDDDFEKYKETLNKPEEPKEQESTKITPYKSWADHSITSSKINQLLRLPEGTLIALVLWICKPSDYLAAAGLEDTVSIDAADKNEHFVTEYHDAVMNGKMSTVDLALLLMDVPGSFNLFTGSGIDVQLNTTHINSLAKDALASPLSSPTIKEVVDKAPIGLHKDYTEKITALMTLDDLTLLRLALYKVPGKLVAAHFGIEYPANIYDVSASTEFSNSVMKAYVSVGAYKDGLAKLLLQSHYIDELFTPDNKLKEYTVKEQSSAGPGKHISIEDYKQLMYADAQPVATEPAAPSTNAAITDSRIEQLATLTHEQLFYLASYKLGGTGTKEDNTLLTEFAVGTMKEVLDVYVEGVKDGSFDKKWLAKLIVDNSAYNAANLFDTNNKLMNEEVSKQVAFGANVLNAGVPGVVNNSNDIKSADANVLLSKLDAAPAGVMDLTIHTDQPFTMDQYNNLAYSGKRAYAFALVPDPQVFRKVIHHLVKSGLDTDYADKVNKEIKSGSYDIAAWEVDYDDWTKQISSDLIGYWHTLGVFKVFKEDEAAAGDAFSPSEGGMFTYDQYLAEVAKVASWPKKSWENPWYIASHILPLSYDEAHTEEINKVLNKYKPSVGNYPITFGIDNKMTVSMAIALMDGSTTAPQAITQCVTADNRLLPAQPLYTTLIEAYEQSGYSKADFIAWSRALLYYGLCKDGLIKTTTLVLTPSTGEPITITKRTGTTDLEWVNDIPDNILEMELPNGGQHGSVNKAWLAHLKDWTDRGSFCRLLVARDPQFKQPASGITADGEEYVEALIASTFTFEELQEWAMSLLRDHFTALVTNYEQSTPATPGEPLKTPEAMEWWVKMPDWVTTPNGTQISPSQVAADKYSLDEMVSFVAGFSSSPFAEQAEFMKKEYYEVKDVLVARLVDYVSGWYKDKGLAPQAVRLSMYHKAARDCPYAIREGSDDYKCNVGLPANSGTNHPVGIPGLNRGDTCPWSDDGFARAGDASTGCPMYRDAFKLTYASVIDPMHADLPEDVWDKVDGKYTIKPKLKDEIEDLVYAYIKPQDVKQILIKGSITSRFYRRNADIDVLVQLRDASMDDAAWEAGKDVFDGYVSTVAPPHPLEVYIDSNYDMDRADSVYNITDDTWVKWTPLPQISLSDYMTAFRSWADKLDIQTAELRRDIVDYELLQEILANIQDAELVRQYMQDLQKKLVEIDEGVAVLADSWQDIHAERAKAFESSLASDGTDAVQKYVSHNLLPGNVVFKLIQRYGYAEILRALSKWYEEHAPVNEGNVEEVKQIVKKAMSTLASLYWILPSGSLSESFTGTHVGWAMRHPESFGLDVETLKALMHDQDKYDLSAEHYQVLFAMGAVRLYVDTSTEEVIAQGDFRGNPDLRYQVFRTLEQNGWDQFAIEAEDASGQRIDMRRFAASYGPEFPAFWILPDGKIESLPEDEGLHGIWLYNRWKDLDASYNLGPIPDEMNPDTANRPSGLLGLYEDLRHYAVDRLGFIRVFGDFVNVRELDSTARERIAQFARESGEKHLTVDDAAGNVYEMDFDDFGDPVFRRAAAATDEVSLLAIRAKDDAAAMEELYDKVDKMLWGGVRHFEPDPQTEEELFSAATLALVNAVRDFDPERGVKFTTFLFSRVKSALLSYFDKLQNVREETTLLGTGVGDVEDDAHDAESSPKMVSPGKSPLSELFSDEEREVIGEALSILSPRDRMIIEWRFGLGDQEVYSAEEIAEKLGLTPQAIHLILHRSLEKLASSVRGL